MTRRVYTIAPAQSIADAAARMRELRIRHLPVTHRGKLVGLLSERDVLRLTSAELDERGRSEQHLEQLAEAITVGEVMTQPIITAQAHTTIGETAHLMIDNKLGCLPIVDAHDHVIGIVTIAQMLELLIEGQWLLPNQLDTPGKKS